MAFMANVEMGKIFDTTVNKGKECTLAVSSAVGSLVQFQQSLHNCLKAHLKQLVKNKQKFDACNPLVMVGNESHSGLEANFHKQLEAWKENPFWVDQPAQIKEVISRKVLIDEGLRQVVEVEQAALWRFLWWSGTISVHVIVDQNRKDHTVKFKQGKSGFMKRFEGCWKVEPLFVDEQIGQPYKLDRPSDYESSTQGKGRVGSVVTLDQLIEPALVPPPPISWYLRGITTRTTEMLINDLLAETARLRGEIASEEDTEELKVNAHGRMQNSSYICEDIKQRWRCRRKDRRHKKRIHLMRQ